MRRRWLSVYARSHLAVATTSAVNARVQLSGWLQVSVAV